MKLQKISQKFYYGIVRNKKTVIKKATMAEFQNLLNNLYPQAAQAGMVYSITGDLVNKPVSTGTPAEALLAPRPTAESSSLPVTIRTNAEQDFLPGYSFNEPYKWSGVPKNMMSSVDMEQYTVKSASNAAGLFVPSEEAVPVSGPALTFSPANQSNNGLGNPITVMDTITPKTIPASTLSNLGSQTSNIKF